MNNELVSDSGVGVLRQPKGLRRGFTIQAWLAILNDPLTILLINRVEANSRERI